MWVECPAKYYRSHGWIFWIMLGLYAFRWFCIKGYDRFLNACVQGPTVSPVYTNKGGKTEVDYYAIIICVPKPQLYQAVRQLRKVCAPDIFIHSSPPRGVDNNTGFWQFCLRLICFGFQAGGSGVLVSPLTYIFDEETPRYRQLLENLQK